MNEEILSPADELRDAFALVVQRIDDTKMKRRYADIISLYDLTKQRDKEPSIGVYGCPKMGKSTLLNSLLGERVLPTSPIPSTSMVINIYRCHRKDYEVNWYEPNKKISDEMRASMTVEEWETRRRGSKSQRHFHDIAGVRGFLEKYASHDGVKSNLAEIEVRGPFENADSRLKSFVLRDTPGAEAVAERAIDEELQLDSKLALQSIGRTNIHLFCVSCRTLAGSHDKAFYDEFFLDRSCIHILTHRDKNPAPDEEIIDEFRKTYELVLNEEEVIKEVVLTGKEDKNSDFISVGREELVEAICNHHDPNFLCKRMTQIAYSLLHERERDVKWDPIKKVPEVFFITLQGAVKKFEESSKL